MRITSKGQVTIPRQLREQAGLLPHTEVEFDLEDGRVFLRLARTQASRGERAVQRLRRVRRHSSLSTDEILALARGE